MSQLNIPWIPILAAAALLTLPLAGLPAAYAQAFPAVCDLFEDFDADDGLWIEYDPQGKIDLDYTDDHRLEFNHWIRYEEGFVHRQHAVRDFIIEYDIKITADGGNAKLVGPGFSDGLQPSSVYEVANGVFNLYYAGFGGAQIDIVTLVDGNPEWWIGGWGNLPNRIWIGVGTTYHVSFEKSGNQLTLSIFSDPSRTTHIPGSPRTVITALSDTAFSYFYILNGMLTPPQGNWEWTTGWMDNMRVCVPDSDGDGVSDTLDVCSETAIPEEIPTVRLGVNRWALADNDEVFDSTPPRGRGPDLSFTLTDTAGCSCGQIITALDLGRGHTKFGCSISAMEAWVAVVNP